jgi:hypothetical protein
MIAIGYVIAVDIVLHWFKRALTMCSCCSDVPVNYMDVKDAVAYCVVSLAKKSIFSRKYSVF